jgi:hypothetical protein
MIRAAALLIILPFLAACQPGAPTPEVNRADPVRVPLVSAASEACWRTDLIPAVTETIHEEAANGTRVSREVLRQPAAERLFAVPCPDQVDSEFIASLQRALLVRGLYSGAATGHWDAETAEAVRRFQAPLGLNSGVLSLDAAQRLGLVAVPRGDH